MINIRIALIKQFFFIILKLYLSDLGINYNFRMLIEKHVDYMRYVGNTMLK